MDTTTETPAPAPAQSGDLDTRPFFAAATTTAAGVIAAVTPDQLEDPTPCTDYDVRRLLGHLVGVADRVAVIGRGEDPLTVHAQVEGIADEGWLEAWNTAVAAAETAWADDVSLERTVALPWATDTGAVALLGYVSEITVHTWDLARATGQTPAWNDDVVERAYELMRRWLPGTNRAEIFAMVRKKMGANASGDDAFAEVVPVPDDAPAIDRLVAWNGRCP